MWLDFVVIILLISFFQFLLFSVYLIIYKKNKNYSNIILSVFFITKSFVILDLLLLFCFNTKFVKFIFNNLTHLFNLGSSFLFLFGPLLFFYTKSLIKSKFKFKIIDIIHIIPFLTYTVFMTFKFYRFNMDIKQQLLILNKNYILNFNEYTIIFGFYYFSVFCYLIYSLLILSNYKNDIKNIFSDIQKMSLSWLKFILTGIIIIVFFVFLNYIWILIYKRQNYFLIFITELPFFIFANLLIFKSLKQSEIINNKDIINQDIKYKKSKLSSINKKLYLEKLLNSMEKDKLYLYPSITIKDISDKLSIPVHYLSQVINELLKKTFFDFINDYRIKEAKNILLDSSNKDKTILEILYEVGYNTKSVFNTSFKKNTGMTPKEYRKKYLLENSIN